MKQIEGPYVQMVGRTKRPSYDEMTEIAIPPASLAEWAKYEYQIAETEMLALCPVTRPDGILLPFPQPPADYEMWPHSRHLKVKAYRLTGRGVALVAFVAGALGGIGAGWLW